MIARRLFIVILALGVAGSLLPGCGGAGVTPNIRHTPPPIVNQNISRVSSDPFTNPSSQHATQVEPDMVAFGSTIVTAFQSGRFQSAGSSDIGFVTSLDGGMTWIAGFLPGITKIVAAGNRFDSVSDPAVAYDARHATWLIASLPILFNGAPAPAVLVSRSNDAVAWSNPVDIAPNQAASDKDWIVCDNTASSTFYGHCYVEWDDPISGRIHMNTSTDGGQTWGPILSTADNATGIGGQPLVQPNGTIVVPISDFNEQNELAFVSFTGGANWQMSHRISPVTFHLDDGAMRSGPLPSAAIDAAGNVYVVWEDCRFRASCTANDLVLSTSSDGLSWTPPARIPIDATTSGIDHFIPGVGIDPLTGGPGAHIGITYYYFSAVPCNFVSCQLFAGFIGSQDGGRTWGAPIQLAGPMSLSSIAQTTSGPMVGDYMATAFSGGQAFGILAFANPSTGSFFDEAMYVTKPGTLTLLSRERRSSAGERPIPGIRSDHPPRHRTPIR